jgi:hypothetical protein
MRRWLGEGRREVYAAVLRSEWRIALDWAPEEEET